MLLMTPAQIKKALRRNARTGARPRSLYEAAKMRGCHRSTMTRAVQNPQRYGEARQWLESVLIAGHAHTQNGRPERATASRTA
jgi:hypothetical protein